MRRFLTLSPKGTGVEDSCGRGGKGSTGEDNKLALMRELT